MIPLSDVHQKRREGGAVGLTRTVDQIVRLPATPKPDWEIYAEIVHGIREVADVRDVVVRATSERRSVESADFAAVEKAVAKEPDLREIDLRLRTPGVAVEGTLWSDEPWWTRPTLRVRASSPDKLAPVAAVITTVIEAREEGAEAPTSVVPRLDLRPRDQHARTETSLRRRVRSVAGSKFRAVVSATMLAVVSTAVVVGADDALRGARSMLPNRPERRIHVSRGATGDDGFFRYRVVGVRCDVTQVAENQGKPRRVRGRGCAVSIEFLNLRERSVRLDGRFEMVVGRQRFEASAFQGEGFAQTIFPRAAVIGHVVFELPEYVSADSVEARLREDHVVILRLAL